MSLLPALVAVLTAAVVIVRWRSRASRRKALLSFRNGWAVPRPVVRSVPGDDRSAAFLDAREYGELPDAIDDRTWTDLDLEDCVATVDRTLSPLGAQALYLRVRGGLPWDAELDHLAELFARDPVARESAALTYLLADGSLGRNLWPATRPGILNIRWWFWSFPVLTGAMLCSLALLPVYPAAFVAATVLLLMNMIARVAAESQVPHALVTLRAIAPVLRVAEALEKTPAIRDSPLGQVADRRLRQLRPLRRILGWLSRDPATVGEGLAAIYEYLNVIFLLDGNALLFTQRYLREGGTTLRRVALWTGDIDCALSVASLRSEKRPWCKPEWTAGLDLHIQGAWHPLIAQPVANDVVVHLGRGIVVTGANMSGKSTFLRTAGTALVLGTSLQTVPAAACSGPALRVRSLFTVQPSLHAGTSYYLAEVDAVLELIEHARSGTATLFLIDELLHGTGTVERLAAGEAVLRELLSARNQTAHATIVATHDGELTASLADLYWPVHFRETLVDGKLTFDYRSHSGPASTRTALALLQARGAPEELLRFAQRRAVELDRRQLSNDECSG